MKTINKTIIGFIVILVIIIAINLTNKMNLTNKTNDIVEENKIEETMKLNVKLEELRDRNMFFTVSSCVNKYLNYVVSKDETVLYNILDNDYITEKEITENNVLSYVEKLTEYQIFEAKKMYILEDGNISTIYVKGKIRDDILDENKPRKDYEVAVKIYHDKNIFTVIPFEKVPLIED